MPKKIVVDAVIEGAQYVFELVNFMMFISQEACQTSIIAINTAITNRKFKHASETNIITLTKARDELAYWTIRLGFLFVPSWVAFYQFEIAARLLSSDLQGEIEYRRRMQLIDPRPDIPGRRRR